MILAKICFCLTFVLQNLVINEAENGRVSGFKVQVWEMFSRSVFIISKSGSEGWNLHKERRRNVRRHIGVTPARLTPK